MPVYIASEMANQREGLRLGYSAPQGNVRIVIKQLDQLLDERIDRSPLYGPALRDSAPGFGDELRRFITNAVVPTIRQYRQFLAKEYLPRARKVIGVSANPNGATCYRGAIQATTGLALSPDSIHRLGRATVAELEAEMRAIAERSFGSRDVTQVLKRLRNDSKYAFRSREAMLIPRKFCRGAREPERPSSAALSTPLAMRRLRFSLSLAAADEGRRPVPDRRR